LAWPSPGWKHTDVNTANIQTPFSFRSIATLCLFALAALVALGFPPVGLGICCCCLILYLKPDAPGTATGKGGD